MDLGIKFASSSAEPRMCWGKGADIHVKVLGNYARAEKVLIEWKLQMKVFWKSG